MRLLRDVAFDVENPYMAHALSLAALASGATAPNPAVGCVIVSGERIVGEGYHRRAGGPHAEVVALEDAGDSARGADVFVTLEPCAHVGRTPPCVDALIAAGVSSVHIGMSDPTPAAGGGAARLRETGVHVTHAEDPSPFADLNAGWLKRLATGLPLVTVKLGLSLDARMTLESGKRFKMTGESGATVTRRLRSRAGAVLVGAATVTADDPHLTSRDSRGVLDDRQPLRVVLVRERIPPADSGVFRADVAPVVVLAPQERAQHISAALPGIALDTYPEEAGLRGAFRALADLGVDDLLIEPGATLLHALWSERLIDRLVMVTAGGMASDAAPPMFSGVADRTGDALMPVVEPVESGIVGNVAVTVWEPLSLDDAEYRKVAQCSPDS